MKMIIYYWPHIAKSCLIKSSFSRQINSLGFQVVQNTPIEMFEKRSSTFQTLKK